MEESSTYGSDLVLAAFERHEFEWILYYSLPFATAGDPHAACMLGVLYQTGNGVEQDAHAAEMWFKRAADRGSIVAWCNLGTLYASGVLGQPDYHLARVCYEKAWSLGGPTDSAYIQI